MSYCKCTIDSIVTPASTVRLSEGYNDGWTVTAYFPQATVTADSAVTMQVNDGTNTLDLTLEPEQLAEDCYGVEVSFRDKCTRRLAHSIYDGSTQKLCTANSAFTGILILAGGISSCRSVTSFGNIHYASTGEENGLTLLNELLDTCGAFYNTDGVSATVCDVHTTADHTLDVVAASRAVNHEGRISRLYLNKVTPCDVVANFVGSATFSVSIAAASVKWSGPFTKATKVGNETVDVVVNKVGGYLQLGSCDHFEGDDRYEYQIVGVTTTSCPDGYQASFVDYYDDTTGNIIKYANRTSTIWAKQSQATARASYYMWLENRDWKTATFTIPLNLAVRTGDVIAYENANYRVTAVTHSLSTTSEATTEVEASAI